MSGFLEPLLADGGVAYPKFRRGMVVVGLGTLIIAFYVMFLLAIMQASMMWQGVDEYCLERFDRFGVRSHAAVGELRHELFMYQAKIAEVLAVLTPSGNHTSWR